MIKPREIKCENCGERFFTKWQDQRFCCRSCIYEFQRKVKIEKDSVEWSCQGCGKVKIVYKAAEKKLRYCSKKCFNSLKRGIKVERSKNYVKFDNTKECPHCKQTFITNGYKRVYCSMQCVYLSRSANAKVKNKCEWCQIEFETTPSKKRRFCEKECILKWREKEFEEGRMMLPLRENKNRKVTDRAKEVGKIKSSIPHRRWRKSVLKRDKSTCTRCGSKLKLQVHHIREFAFFPEDRFDVNNGVTLCKECHKKLHKDMKRVGIVGNGWVGKAVNKLFPNALIYDPLEPERHTLEQVNTFCDVVFICVPTPNLPDGSLDTSIVEECVAKSRCPLIIIRSTVNPGTTDRLTKKYGKRIVFQPEYIGESFSHPLLDPKGRDFLIFGGNQKDVTEAIEIYTKAYNANIKIRRVTPYEAEVIKLSENRAISFKVAQCQELYDACQAADVDYYTIREAVYGDDPRFDLWFTFIYPNKRGMNSKCIPKDVYAWAAWAESMGSDAKITRALLDKNIEWLSLNVPETELEHIPTQAELKGVGEDN